MFKFKLCKVSQMQGQLNRIFDEMMAKTLFEMSDEELWGDISDL